ncbi:transcription termination/antitermination NusG family protein [Mesorhizobium sp.]|uniref:transcription termination/antitermination protein NusG n=1 Tax=Mesorhizobium sp. TaxID=1871066 RepID=UPI000FE3E531|nr:transcription termination/antitermination NusG family protein [Mesorhizobium sp.]RWK39262.1 MAG: hypothetical protein EOR40_04430 [Mesorhizobium sp.]
MTWFAVRTKPGSQMPQRTYEVEETRSAKGYRLIPSLDPNMSAVEVSLKRGGFAFYMPAEQRVVRDRKKTNVWTKRRFALLLGYVFVDDTERAIDWQKLEEKTPGIERAVRVAGKPMAILESEMDLLREMEAESDEIANAKLRFFQEQAEAKNRTRRVTASLFPAGTMVRIVKGVAEHKVGKVTGLDREGRLKLLVQKLEMSVPMDAVRIDLEAAE